MTNRETLRSPDFAGDAVSPLTDEKLRRPSCPRRRPSVFADVLLWSVPPGSRRTKRDAGSIAGSGDCAWSQGTLDCFGSNYSVLNTMDVIGQSPLPRAVRTLLC
jgi:hypothetical protein